MTSLNGKAAGLARRSDGYGSSSVREVQARAATVDQSQTEHERQGLRRLNQVLSNDQANDQTPRENVPRGFYLNIEI
ncbi:MAG: hypothetical protein HOH04_05040 [Rhodospirillaceae bacterium]|nr:hypothetical protein [Rhodospirillaceae bacterium]